MRGGFARHCDVPEFCLAERHKYCGGNALAGYVADDNANFAVGKFEKVVKVAAYELLRQVFYGEFEAVCLREIFGEKVALYAACKP